MESALIAARAYVQIGLSVIPVARDGSKRPAFELLPSVIDEATGAAKRTWLPYTSVLPTIEEVDSWFDRPNPPGPAIVGGAVSGNLEQIDFDTFAETIYPQWCELVELEAPGLVARLSVAKTPKPGFHARYRVEAGFTVPGNDKLAMDPALPSKERTLIETRGEGGYALAPGCPACCHETGQLYVHFSGPKLSNVQTITATERDVLVRCARSFDRSAPEDPKPQGPQRKAGSGPSPGDRYNAAGPSWEVLLEPHGWRKVRDFGGRAYWCRPDKDGTTWSATTGLLSKSGRELFCVFSSNASPFSGPTGGKSCSCHDKFGVFVLLYHGGDFSAAAKALNQEQTERNGKAAEPPAGIIVLRASDVVTRKVGWLWPWRIPIGKMTTFAGMGGLGKTFISCDIAARVSTGAPWPESGGECAEVGDVLYISGEDDPEDTLVPRMKACGADLNRICFLKASVADSFNLSALKVLTKAVEQTGPNVRLIVIDPPASYLGDKDEHKNAEVRSLLTPIKEWLTDRLIAFLFICHLNKGSGQKVDAMMRVMGSVAWVNAVRAAHLFTKDPEDDDRTLFVPMKNNLGPKKNGLAYRLFDLPGGMARVEWLGEVDTTADQAMGRGTPRRAAATQWLIESFRKKLEWHSDELMAAAKQAGISRSAVFEAKKILNLPKCRQIVSESGDRIFVWWVPPNWDRLNEKTGDEEAWEAGH